MKQSLRRIGLSALAILLLAYALKDISFGDILSQFQRANYGLIALACLVTVISYLTRGQRWRQPLQTMGYRPSLLRSTIAMQTGVISSMIVLGSGELTRCLTLQRTDGVPVAQGVGSVVAERIIDLFMLMLVLILTVLLEFGRMRAYLAGLTLAVPNTYLLLGAASAVVIGGLVVRWLLTSRAVRAHPLTVRLLGVVQGFGQGFMAIRQLPQPALFVGLTVLNQVWFWLGTYLLLLAVDSTRSLPPTAALTIMAVSSLGGLAVPTQSGIGTYHFLVSRALVLYGFSAVEGAVIATFLHAVGFGINLLLSSASFLAVPALIQSRPQSVPVQ